MSTWRRSAAALGLIVLAASLAAALDAPRPDLTVADARAESELVAGEPARLLVRIENQGRAAADCSPTLRGEAAGATASRAFPGPAAGSVAHVALDLPGVPAGEHDLTLSVDAAGCGEETTGNNAATFRFTWRPRAAVSATLAAQPTAGRAPLDVAFSVSAPAAVSWRIDFGDGAHASGTGAPPAVLRHVYGAGAHAAVLRAVNGSATDESSVQIDVDAAAQAAAVRLEATPPEGPAPLDVELAPRGAERATAWQLDFGDGTSASGAGPPAPVRHVYSAGRAVAILQIETADGPVEATATVRALAPPRPAPRVSLALDRAADEAPAAVTARIDVSADATTWRLAWGDGAIDQGPAPAPATLAHRYDLPGLYRAILEARGPGGLASTAVAPFEARGRAGLDVGGAWLRVEPANGSAPFAATLLAGCTCRDVLAWRVDFGDGASAFGTGTPPAIPHTYVAGEHHARLTLTTLRGDIEADAARVVVASLEEPLLSIAVEPGRIALRIAPPPDEAAPWRLRAAAREWEGVGTVEIEAPAVGEVVATLAWGDRVAARATALVPAGAPALLTADADGLAPLSATLRLAASNDTLHWALVFGDGRAVSGSGPPPDAVSHTYGAGTYTVKLVAVSASGAATEASAPLVVRAAPPRLDVSARSLLLVLEADEGRLLVDGREATLFEDSGGLLPADRVAGGPRFLPCTPGTVTLRLETAHGTVERVVECPTAATTGRTDTRLDPTRETPGVALVAAVAAALAAALRRRGVALLVVGLAIGAGADARFHVLNDEEAHERTLEGDRVTQAAAGRLVVTSPQGEVFTGGASVPIPAGRIADGTWTVTAAPTGCALGFGTNTVAYVLGGRDGALTGPCAPVVWEFVPNAPPTYVSVGARTDVGVGPDAWVYHPWGPRDYEARSLASTLATATDYDLDGAPTTGEAARGTCPLSGSAGCPGTAAAPLPDDLAASVAWETTPAWAGLANVAALTVSPPGNGALTRVDVRLPDGFALDVARTTLPDAWTLSTDGRDVRILLRAPERHDGARAATPETFRLALDTPAVAGAAALRVDAMSAHDAHPGATASVPLALRTDALAPRVSTDAPAWARGPIDVRIAATDPESGLARIRHRIGDGPWVAADTLRLAMTDGASSFSWEATDRAGNVATGAALVALDASAPTVGFASPPGLYDAPFDVGAVASDEDSGVAAHGVRIAGVESATARLATEGEHVVEAFARDAAGNEARVAGRFVLALPGAARVTATAAPATPRPGEPVTLLVSVANLRPYALTGVVVDLGADRVALGDLAAGATATASFTRLAAPDAAWTATASWSTPWRSEAAGATAGVTATPLRAVDLVCLPASGRVGAPALLACAVANRGDLAAELTVDAGGAPAGLSLAPGSAALVEVPAGAYPAAPAGATVVVRDAAGVAATTNVPVAGVVSRALVVTADRIVNLGSLTEDMPLGRLEPGASMETGGPRRLSLSADDGSVGFVDALVVAPGRLVSSPPERGVGLQAARDGEGIRVSDAHGPLPGALVVGLAQARATDAAGLASPVSGTVEVRWRDARLRVP